MLVGRGVVGAMTVGIRGVLVIVGAKGVRVVKGVAWSDDACEEDEDEGTEAVREEMSIVIVVEAAPEGSGDGVDRVGRIIELVLLSVNLGMEIDDEDEGIRLPAVDIGDDVRAGVGESGLACVCGSTGCRGRGRRAGALVLPADACTRSGCCRRNDMRGTLCHGFEV